MKSAVLELSCMSTGAGDVLAALWAVFAAKREGFQVRFHVPANVRGLLEIFLEPDEIGEGKRQEIEFFLPWQTMNNETVKGESRTAYFLRKLPEEARGISVQQPSIRPGFSQGETAEFSGKILLFPVANYLERMWPLHHWQTLGKLLKSAGFEVLFCTDESARSAGFCSSLEPRVTLPNWQSVARAMLSARAIVANDSGPLHMAAASGVPGVAIFAQMPRSFCGDYASIRPVTPSWSGTCAGCNFLPSRGAKSPACRAACHELWSISPRSALEAVYQTTGKP